MTRAEPPRKRHRINRHVDQVNTCDRPTRAQLIDRDMRLSLPARDLTGAILGDPPVGRSALDKKQRREAQALADSHGGIFKTEN